MIYTKQELINDKKYVLFELLDLTKDQLRELSKIDITCGDEHLRSNIEEYNFFHDKDYNKNDIFSYLLSEFAYDSFIQYLMPQVKPEEKDKQFIFEVCCELSKRGYFNSVMLYLIYNKLYGTKYADKIINLYDIDRERGRKRVMSIIKDGAI